MKTILTFSFIVTSLLSHSQWTSVTTGTNSTIIDVDLASPTLGYYHFGWPTDELMKTTNGGMNWSGTGKIIANFNLLQCVGVDTIYVQKLNGYEYSYNAGSSWQSSTVNGAYNEVYSMHFPNNQIGYATGMNLNWDSLLIFKTTDAGQNWNLHKILDGFSYTDVFFTNTSTGFLATDGLIYKTTDGGTNWTIKFSQLGVPFNNVFFVDDMNGYAIGVLGDLAKTIDGGENWTLNTSALLQDDPISTTSDLHFINKDTGYVTSGYVGNGVPSIQYTVDGGNSWGISHVGTNGLEAICFFDETTGLAAGGAGELLRFGPMANSIFDAFEDELLITENSTFFIIHFSDESNKMIDLFDISGKQILNFTTVSSEFYLNKYLAQPGIYILNVSSDNKIYSKKIVFK